MRIKNDESKESEKEKEKKKPKLTEEEINDNAYQFKTDLYHKEHIPTNLFEDFIMKENKIEEMVKSMKKLDKDDQEKAFPIINKNAIDDNQKEKAKKLSH